MVVYYLLFLSFAYFYILFSKVTIHGNERIIRSCIYGCAVLCLLAFRHPSMGADLAYGSSFGYLGSFQYISSLSFSQVLALPSFLNYQKGYVFFNWFLGLFGNNDQILLIGCAFASIVPVIILFYKKSESLELSYIIYLSLQSFLICFSGLRQGISVGICMIAFLFIQEHRYKVFILLVLLATSFHPSAILFFLAYPLYYIKISKKNRWISVAILMLTFALKVPLFNILSKVFKPNATIVETGALTFFCVFCLIYVFCFLFAEENEQNNGMLNLMFIACFCLSLTSVFSTAMRASYCYMNILPLILPATLNKINNKYFSLSIKLVVVICFCLFALITFYSSSWAKSYPYSFFWN